MESVFTTDLATRKLPAQNLSERNKRSCYSLSAVFHNRPHVMRHTTSFLPLAVFFTALLGSACSLPKYTTVSSEQPPDYYLGESPEVSVVNAEGATRRMQDIAIQELRTQSRSNGHFTIENRLDEGIRFDVRQRKMVMTGKDVSVSSDDVFVKFNVVASMKQDGRTTITRQTGVLGTETEEVPAVVTVMPVTFTVAKGEEVLLSERQYDGRAVWPIEQGGGDYPPRQQRYEAAIGKAVESFLEDITPRTVSRRVRLDYSDENQEPILDVARNGQVKQAATQMEEYAQEHPNSSSAYYNLAVLTDAMGQYEQAIEYYDKALSLGGKDYYTEVKASCQERLQEQRELETESSTSEKMEEVSPASTGERNAASDAAPSQMEERPGDGGDDVEWVQTTLNNLGHACGPEDGVMGPNTRSCIRSFQKANDLEVTGKINEATYQKMLEKR